MNRSGRKWVKIDISLECIAYIGQLIVTVNVLFIYVHKQNIHKTMNDQTLIYFFQSLRIHILVPRPSFSHSFNKNKQNLNREFVSCHKSLYHTT